MTSLFGILIFLLLWNFDLLNVILKKILRQPSRHTTSFHLLYDVYTTSLTLKRRRVSTGSCVSCTYIFCFLTCVLKCKSTYSDTFTVGLIIIGLPGFPFYDLGCRKRFGVLASCVISPSATSVFKILESWKSFMLLLTKFLQRFLS